MMQTGFGHFNRVSGERKHPEGYWTLWDYMLVNVFQLITDFTDSNGFLAWEVDDPQERMMVVGTVKIDRAEQAKKEVEKRNAKAMEQRPGAYVSLSIRKVRDEDDYPSHSEYFEDLAKKAPRTD